MLLRLLLLLAALALPTLPAAAQPTSPASAAAPADADALAAARTLIEATGMSAMMSQVLDGMRAPLVQALRQQSPQLPVATVESAVDEVLMPEFRARLPELTNSTANIYVRNFSLAELHELAAFYNTPIGRKTLQVMPQILQQSMAMGQSWGQSVAQDALSKNRAALRSRGINL